MVTVPATAGRCRTIAALESPHPAGESALARLMKEIEATGADAIKVSCSAGAIDGIDQLVKSAAGVDVVVAPYDLDAVRECRDVAFDTWKIDAPLLTHLPVLEAVAADGRPVLAGVAGCTSREIQEAVARLPQTAVLIHTLTFGCDAVDVSDVAHLAALRRYERPVGYADCSLDPSPALVAAALGATVIEKPLTLERAVSRSDQRATLLPHEFRSFVTRLRRLEEVLAGDGARDPLPDELDTIEQHRVSIVASRPIPRGTVIEADMLTLKAPAIGLSARFLSFVEGRRASYDIAEGTAVTFGVIEL